MIKRISIFIIIAVALIYSPAIQASYWVAMPPYNVLWPLWSPALSPVDPLTGVPIPLLTHVDKDTILPVQPGLVWDPFMAEPFLLYNNPLVYFGGLLYFSQLFGFNAWPPPYLLNPEIGIPLPITLPLGYQLLPPTDYTLLSLLVPLANDMFSTMYGVPLTSLLPVNLIWGK